MVYPGSKKRDDATHTHTTRRSFVWHSTQKKTQWNQQQTYDRSYVDKQRKTRQVLGTQVVGAGRTYKYGKEQEGQQDATKRNASFVA
jgi:hypothetical protein